MANYYWDRVDAPWGPISVCVDDSGRLVRIDVRGGRPSGTRDGARCAAVTGELREYFAGRRSAFTLAVAPGGTEFQRRVWQALTEIPYGSAITYGELARRIGQPGAARAVGGANGANPIPIVIPCHRVVASGGRLGGYSGGLAVKEALLGLEGLELAA